MKGKEEDENLGLVAKALSDDMKEIESKGIEVNGKMISVKWILVADYKCLLILLGIGAANSKFSCCICTVCSHKRYIHNTLFEKRDYNNVKLGKYSQKKLPLLPIHCNNIELSKVHASY